MTAPLDQLLTAWMPQQRWYPAKGRGVGVRLLATRDLPSDEAGVRVTVHVVGLDSGDRFDVVQVPLTYRTDSPADDAAVLGEVLDPDGEHAWASDGPHDPAFVAALLRDMERPASRPAPRPVRSRVLRGEQSNTSVIVETDHDPVIVKVFRSLHPGQNPDVEVLRALDGSEQVPGLVGWSSGRWPDRHGAETSGHLAVATEFVADGRDAWREAAEAVAAGDDFTERAHSLGLATATLHGALATAFGTTPADDATRARLRDALRDRVAWALSSTDALTRFRDALTRRADDLRVERIPALQRVHGDYHLGQVLHSPTRGWVILDFEGEPLRPLAERTRPDLALRDVAGMLRSFDYAAGQVRVESPDRGAAADAWAGRARDAFCRGYAAGSGHDPREDAELLAALELDKALYEVVYEAGNRPAWIDVPLSAVERLVGAASG
ncbi:phosphotransferase [Isoptericola sp. b441]|uniref:Maltokinase n=1 Tax=Actinotalea lenta TaxID=3064654 RepID=A0ABT9DF83_9CELL|nr:MULTISPECIES: phosphotransferase [unclassified Isoptericola]MDO8108252.1 phosphotransferase [Isoptericola sp. b441]MDO8120074.1 phosphotransferase [Isoptericola sp. b490]